MKADSPVRPIVSHAVRITSEIVMACKMCHEKLAGGLLSRTGGSAEEASMPGGRRRGPYVRRAVGFPAWASTKRFDWT